MDHQFKRLPDEDFKFGFLLNTEELCYGYENTNLRNKCIQLGKVYKSKFDGEHLYEEILDCRMWLTSRTDKIKLQKPEEVLAFIVQYGDESVFPNLRIEIQTMLTIAVSIASCER